MDHFEIRMRCVEAAVKCVGNPNVIQQAKAFLDFVMEAEEPLSASQQLRVQKGTRK